MPFPIEQQQQALWCWAAVGVSVDHFFTPESNWTQCGVVKDVFPGIHCCDDPERCNKAASLRDALQAVGRYQKTLLDVLSFDAIREQIDAGLPIGVRIKWQGGGGHFVAITGYYETPSGKPFVEVADPLFGIWQLPYQTLRFAYQSPQNLSNGGKWTHTYLVHG